MEREIDLIEEIARLHGYNKFSNTLPGFSGAVIETSGAKKHAKVRSSLLALGYHEAVSLSFISHEDAETFSSSPVIELANPISEEASLMRSSLVPGMLNLLAYNLNRGADNVRLFEVGDVYETEDDGTAEHSRICLERLLRILEAICRKARSSIRARIQRSTSSVRSREILKVC